MSKSLIEGASPAEELLLSFKKPAEEKLPDEEGRKPAGKPTRKSRGSGSRDLSTGKRSYRINLALPEALGEALRDEAKRQSRSVNNLAEIILREYLTK